MSKRAGAGAAAAAVAFTMLGCAPQAQGPSVEIEDRVYAVSPSAIDVKAGIMTGQVTDMKVMERVEKGSGNVVSPARLTGKLLLKNSSSDQSVRLIEGTFRFMDEAGSPIMADQKRVEPTFKFSGYGMAERLDPGQEATQSLDVDFPADGLAASKLRTIRLEVVYLPTSYRQESVDMNVSLAAP